MFLGSNIHIGTLATMGGGNGAILFTASDNFSGVYPNSASIPGTYFDQRWFEEWIEGVSTITGGVMELIVSNGNPKLHGWSNNGEATDGFTSTVKFEMAAYLDNNTITQGANFRLHDSLGNFIGQIIITKSGADTGSVWAINADPGGTVTSSYSSDVVWFKMVRADGSSTVNLYYSDDGITYTDTLFTLTTSATIKTYVLGFSRWTLGNLTINVDDYTLTDGSGNPIVIP